MLELLLFSLVGWVLFLVGNFESYNQSKPGFTRWQAYTNYMLDNLGFLISSLLVTVILTKLVADGMGMFLAKLFGIMIEDPGSQFGLNKLICLGMGINIESVINLLRRIFKPVKQS